MKLSTIRQVLARHQIQLSKSLGQHFLHDQNQLRRIVACAELTPADSVLEIGPGLGPLTELLLARAGVVLAVEKDERLVRVLRERLAGASHLTLVHADAVDYLEATPRDWRRWKLVANLPYSATSSMLTALARLKQGPDLMIVTVQWEVAQRLLAAAGEQDYSVLTLLMQLRYQPQHWFKIPRPCFFPIPEVESATLTLRRRPHDLLPADQADGFAQLVRLSFSQRRKMMLKRLKTQWPAELLQGAFGQCGLAPDVRAETVPLETFIRLTQTLASPNLRRGGLRRAQSSRGASLDQ